MNRFLLLTSACVFLAPHAYAETTSSNSVEYPEDMLAEATAGVSESATTTKTKSKSIYIDPVDDHGKPEAHVDVKTTGPLVASASMNNGFEEAQEEPASGHEKTHEHAPSHAWGYSGDKAADKWGDLDAQYKACKDGLKQSPVNIQAFMRDDSLPDIAISYSEGPLVVDNNGHTVHVNAPEGNTAVVGTKAYDLVQLHFHTPSEHYIDGVPFPMEAHFVHKDAKGTLGVFGVMMKLGEENPAIQTIWEHVPADAGMAMPKDVKINVADLFPADKSYYKYQGSLTTPPCSEGVRWHVLKEPIEISQEQLVTFQALFPMNARPLQPLNDRVVKSK